MEDTTHPVPGRGLPPDRQQRLQHLLRAAADLAFMWENDVLMVNRQANRCGEMEDHRSSPPSQKETR